MTRAKKSQELADEALKARLYVSGWYLSECLRAIRADSSLETPIELFKEKGKAVGVTICFENQIMVFVRKSHRRKGIGSILVKRLISNYNLTDFNVDWGIYGSEFFWKKTVGINPLKSNVPI